MQSQLADVDIHPDLGGCGVFDDNKNEEIYQSGKCAAEKALPQIKRILKDRGIY